MQQASWADFAQEEFYKAYRLDLRQAQCLVLLQSPYASVRRINYLLPELQGCIRRGIRVCAFIQEPEEWQKSRNYDISVQLEAAVKLLRSAGVHITLRRLIHEKLTIIDEVIVWDGSLNILSHSQTSERMTRWVGREKAQSVMLTHRLYDCQECAPSSAFRLFVSNHTTEVRAKVLGRNIVRVRKSMRLSQRDLAKQARIQQKVLSDVELGKRNVSLQTLSSIGQQIGMEITMVARYMLPTIERMTDQHITRLSNDQCDETPLCPDVI
jgi:DNA-binding XRE family transcriptional regulator